MRSARNTQQHTARTILELGGHPNCIGAFISIPCGTWSVLRYNRLQGSDPGVLRRLPHHADGIPLADGTLHPSVVKANRMLEVACGLGDVLVPRGCFVVFESPVGHSANSNFPYKGRDDHASMWDSSRMQEFMKYHNTKSVQFDQCPLGSNAQKTTQLECSANVFPLVYRLFGSLICDHPPGHHDRLPGEMSTMGTFKSAAYAHYPPDMNRRLAHIITTFASQATCDYKGPTVPVDPLTAWSGMYCPESPHEFVEDDKGQVHWARRRAMLRTTRKLALDALRVPSA